MISGVPLAASLTGKDGKAGDAGRHGLSFPGGGEMGARITAFDWAQTPIGPIHTWPQNLRTATQMMLASRYSVQLPGSAGAASGGQPQFIEPLACAAVATGAVNGIFV